MHKKDKQTYSLSVCVFTSRALHLHWTRSRKAVVLLLNSPTVSLLYSFSPRIHAASVFCSTAFHYCIACSSGLPGTAILALLSTTLLKCFARPKNGALTLTLCKQLVIWRTGVIITKKEEEKDAVADDDDLKFVGK